MSIIQRASRVGNRSGRGFSMLEVMFALMILGIGLIAVASILPVAGVMQRETVDEVHTQQVAESVKAQVAGRGFSRMHLNGFYDRSAAADDEVYPFPSGSSDGLNALPSSVEPPQPGHNRTPWNLADRSYPRHMRAELAGGGLSEDENTDFTNRQYYWVPLVQRREDESWRVYVFVLRNEQTRRYFVDDGYLDEVANPDDGYVNDGQFFRVPVVRRTPDGAISEARAGTRAIYFDHSAADQDDEYPFFSPFDLDVGSQFLDNYGVIHTVVLSAADHVIVSAPIAEDKEPEYIWYGVPSETGRIPTRKILRFGSEVVR